MVSGISSSISTDPTQQIQQQSQTTGVHRGHGHHKMDPQSLINKLGGDSSGITEDQLNTALQTAQSQGNSRETDMIQNLLKNFASMSGGSDKITASSLQQAFQSNAASGQTPPPPNDSTQSTTNGPVPQNPGDVTSNQLQPPIDLSIV